MLITYSILRCRIHEGKMSDSDNNQEEIEDYETFNIEGMSEEEVIIRKRREDVYVNMCKPPRERVLVKDMAKKYNVDPKTIARDKQWCRTDRPLEWVNLLAKHGFLSNTMQYETHMKNNLEWLYGQRDDAEEPSDRLGFQKEITATLNNIVAVGSKHPFYEGIKKIIAENEEKEQ